MWTKWHPNKTAMPGFHSDTAWGGAVLYAILRCILRRAFPPLVGLSGLNPEPQRQVIQVWWQMTRYASRFFSSLIIASSAILTVLCHWAMDLRLKGAQECCGRGRFYQHFYNGNKQNSVPNPTDPCRTTQWKPGDRFMAINYFCEYM